jgi:RimJ/RimL family protein N-acetyltransferase
VTPQVRIEHLSHEALAVLASGDLDAARAVTGRPLTPWQVSEGAVGTWRRRAVQVVQVPQDLPWVTGLLIDQDTGEVVGAAGFHAAPDSAGMVEVGYGVDPAYRRRGYARAALMLMIDRAKSDPSVQTFRVTVSPDNTASLRLVAQLPFVEVGEQWDDEDGLEIIYEVDVQRR